MIKNVSLGQFIIKPWIKDKDFAVDDESVTWIWNQLMGETAKGDTLEFVKIRRSVETLFAGILKDARNEIKAIIPARYERYRDGILDTVDYAGRTEHDEGEKPGYEFKEGHVDIDFEAFAQEFLTSEEEMTISFSTEKESRHGE